MNIISISIKIDSDQTIRTTIQIYNIYNLSSKDYKAIYNKKSLSIIATILRISSENVLVEDFNLYYAI